MYKREKRSRFVLLRAQGNSIRAIADELGISTSTVWQWNGEHAAEILQLSRSGIGMLMTDLGVDKAERLKMGAALFTSLYKNIEKDISSGAAPESEKLGHLIKLYQLICKEDPSTVMRLQSPERPESRVFLKPIPQPDISEMILNEEMEKGELELTD